MDTSTSAFDNVSVPGEGDISMCLRCGSLSVFNADRTLRKPTQEENERYARDPRITQAQMTRAYVVADKSRRKRS
jgi:hypothetical protein